MKLSFFNIEKYVLLKYIHSYTIPLLKSLHCPFYIFVNTRSLVEMGYRVDGFWGYLELFASIWCFCGIQILGVDSLRSVDLRIESFDSFETCIIWESFWNFVSILFRNHFVVDFTSIWCLCGINCLGGMSVLLWRPLMFHSKLALLRIHLKKRSHYED